MNNKRLLVFFISGIILLLAGRYFQRNKSASFDSLIIAVDTAAVDRIQFAAKMPAPETFELQRKDTAWHAVKGDLHIDVSAKQMRALLRPFSALHAQRMITNDVSRHPEYEVDDAQATHVIIWENGKQVSDLLVGGFRFDQVARTASVYVRKAGEDDVYVIDGLAGMGLKTRLDQLRDKKLLHTPAMDITMLEWKSADGIPKKLIREQGHWYFAGMEAVDSIAFDNYLNSLVNAQGAYFSDLTMTDGLSLAEQLTVYGNNMEAPAVIRAFMPQDTSYDFLIHSSVNPNAVFTSDSAGLYKRIFTDLRPHLLDE